MRQFRDEAFQFVVDGDQVVSHGAEAVMHCKRQEVARIVRKTAKRERLVLANHNFGGLDDGGDGISLSQLEALGRALGDG